MPSRVHLFTTDWTIVMPFLPTLRSHYWLLSSPFSALLFVLYWGVHRAGLTQLIRERLHWLPVPGRIATFKLASLVYNVRAPDYLARMCTGVESVEAWARLRSAAVGKWRICDVFPINLRLQSLFDNSNNNNNNNNNNVVCHSCK